MTKLRATSVLSGSALYLMANVANAATPFLLLPILTRILSPRDYGALALFQALISGLAGVVGLNSAASATRKFFDSPAQSELRSHIGSCLQIIAISAVVCSMLFIAFSTYVTEWLGIDASWVIIAVVISAGSAIINIRLGQWQARGLAHQYAAFQLLQSAANFFLSVLFVAALAMGAWGRVYAQASVVIFFGVVALVLLWRVRLFSVHSWNSKETKEALQFGIPLVPHVLGGFVLTAVDRFVINSELGLASAGTYMVAVQISMAMAITFDAVNKAFVPWLFGRLDSGTATENCRIVRRTYAWFAVAFVLAFCVYLAGPVLIVSIAGEQYSSAASAVGWLALGQAFGGMYLMVTNYVFYAKRTGLLSIVSLSSGIANVLLLIVLVPSYGIAGAGAAFAAAMSVRFVATWIVAQRCHPMPWVYALTKRGGE